VLILKSIPLDEQTAERLKRLSDATGKSQIEILRQLIYKMALLADSFGDEFTFMINDGTDTITIQFYGKKVCTVHKINDLPESTATEQLLIDAEADKLRRESEEKKNEQ
jgi:predicted DNA-binding protein